MKNFLPAFLPALALLALSGCASTSGLATSEDDGVYYSSKDHTTATAPSYQSQGYANQGYNNQGNAAAGGSYNQPQQATPQTQTDEAANPDYNYNTNGAGGAIQNNSGNSQYYDNSYQGSGNSAYNQGYSNGYSNGLYSSSYYAPGVAYYSPLAYAPYTSLGYGYSSYGWGGGYCGYSPYGYSSFYNPYGYGYGSGLSISFGYGGYYGSPYGYGYGNPYSYYGYGYGNPYRYGSYYGYGGGYDPYYGYGYGGRNVIYTGSGHYSGSGNGNTVLVGPRRGRGGDVVTGGRLAGPATTGNSPVRTGGRTAVTEGGIVAPGGVGSTGGRASNPDYSGGGTAPALNNPGRGRTMESTQSYNAPATMPETAVGGGRIVRQQNLQLSSQPSAQPSSMSDERQPASYGNGRTRNFENAPMGQVNTQPAPQTMPQGADAQPTRRGGFFGGGGQGNQQPQRNYEQPQQRSYEQPQRSYEQPQRSESRSFGGGGGGNFGGGGNSGGGGGGGRRGR